MTKGRANTFFIGCRESPFEFLHRPSLNARNPLRETISLRRCNFALHGRSAWLQRRCASKSKFDFQSQASGIDQAKSRLMQALSLHGYGRQYLLDSLQVMFSECDVRRA